MPIDYLDNKLLEATIVRFKEAKRDGRLSEAKDLEEQLAGMFYTLTHNIIVGFKFKTLDYDDALQEGVCIALQRLEKFDPSHVGANGKKAKAFNYLTTCILNHMRQLFRNSMRVQDTHRRYHEHLTTQQTDCQPTRYLKSDVFHD